MPPAFSSANVTPTSVSDFSSDNSLPSAKSLNYGSITSATGLSGTTGSNAQIIHGDHWEMITGSETLKITRDQTVEIKGNEAHSVTKNLSYIIVGQTSDTRMGVHHQWNVSPRFENYAHTLTQDHHEKLVVHQPTTIWDIVNQYFSFKKAFLSTTGLSLSGTATSVSLTATSGSGTVMSASNTVFSSSKESFSIKDLDIGLHVRGMITELKAVKIKAAVSHLKAIGANLCAGIAANMDSPFA